MGWLGKLLGGDSRKDVAEGADAADAVATPAGVDAEAADGAELALDLAWYRWLAGTPTLPPAPGSETRILDRLAQLAADPDTGAALVPRVPEIIPQLMRILREDDMSIGALARQLAQDPVLVAELYREANRPCYRPRYHAGPPINSIDGAIMLLGQNGMRMLLVRVALRPLLSMQSGRLARRSAPRIWRQSEKCALAASILAPGLRANPFEAYLAGLMQNVGLVVAFRLLDALDPERDPEEALPQSADFVDALFAHARRLSARIAALWEFPAGVAEAIAAEDADTPLVRALTGGDRLAKLRMLVDEGRLDGADPAVTAGLDAAGLDVLERIRDEEDE